MREKGKSYIFSIITSLFFVASFVVNITSDTPLYNLDLNTVPDIQNNDALGSRGFIIFMNIVSNIFNPVICAGYIGLFWLISHRKFQIMVFLVWFISISWMLIILSVLSQARPYWVNGSGVQMLQWTCYTQYGLPSGHSMLGLVLMQFIVRFFVRGYPSIRKLLPLFYIIVFILQILVMFSRVILGMHTYNEVLMGAMWGLYSLAIYYNIMEEQILKYMSGLFKTQSKILSTAFLLIAMTVCIALELFLYLFMSFSNDEYWEVINSIQGCNGALLFKSFQYKCLEDSALIMAAFGLLIGLIWMSRPQYLLKSLNYSRLTFTWIAKLLITILSAGIPVAIFLNPLWLKIQLDTSQRSLLIWGCQNLGFFIGISSMLIVAPLINNKCDFERYEECLYHLQATSSDVEGLVIQMPEIESKQEHSCL